VGLSHGNKGDALGLVVDKVVKRRHESIGEYSSMSMTAL
jgi:hypothetical protein